MVTLLESDDGDSVSIIRKYSILVIIISLFLLDKFYVRRDGDYIIIGDTALEVGDLILLFLLALAIVALMRPMEQKKYQRFP
ncbi:MAG: hypothetical protein GPJ54_06245 [Candidatus Heimdallarchaeota archaeon]|nr:hypothetical protein [Candidatus Heimdallarchaeota archaeon]